MVVRFLHEAVRMEWRYHAARISHAKSYGIGSWRYTLMFCTESNHTTVLRSPSFAIISKHPTLTPTPRSLGSGTHSELK